ncbi:MAG: polyhydroxyalkanoic acid system family protein [Dehalococcoidia bacterium]
MKIEYRHGKSAQEAYERIDGLLTALEAQYKDQISDSHRAWNDTNDRMEFGLEAMGQRISGTLSLEGEMAILELKLPLLARMFSGRLERIVREELDKLFP